MGDMADWTNEMGEQGMDYDRQHPEESMEPEPPEDDWDIVICEGCGNEFEYPMVGGEIDGVPHCPDCLWENEEAHDEN